MALNKHLRITAARWGTVAVLVVAALGVGALVAQAYEHATPVPHSGAAAPVPTFTLGVRTPTPTPTPTPAPIVDRAAERFLTAGTGAGANVWWRGVAGRCGGAAPVVERSTNGGATWTNVTPPDAAQLASIEVFNQTEADLIVGVGANCEPQALRTFTQGQFWEPAPDAVAASRFVVLTDPATVATPTGPIAAPCAQAHGLRSSGGLATLVCDRVAYVTGADGTWIALPAPDAAAVAMDGDGVLAAHSVDDCAGSALTRFVAADPARPEPVTCIDAADLATPVALATTATSLVVWSVDTVIQLDR